MYIVYIPGTNDLRIAMLLTSVAEHISPSWSNHAIVLDAIAVFGPLFGVTPHSLLEKKGL